MSLKWFCAPKGSGFLWARPEHHGWIEPLVVSWGYGDDADFGERYGWQGTRDPAAYLAVPAAIDAHATFDLERCQRLADLTENRLRERDLVRVPGTPAPSRPSPRDSGSVHALDRASARRLRGAPRAALR